MTSVVRGSDNFDSASVLGNGQTWQNVLSSRATGVTYTNSTSKPIIVAVQCSGATTAGGGFDIYVQGIWLYRLVGNVAGSGFLTGTSFIVPPGQTYRVDAAGTVSLSAWTELR